MTTRVSLLARILIGIFLSFSPERSVLCAELKSGTCSALRTRHLLLKRLVDNVRQRRIAVEDIYVKSFIFQRAHGIEAFFFPRPAAAHPDPHVFEFAIGLGLPKAVDDAAEGLLHVREIGNGSANDNVLDAGQRTHLFC